MVQKKNTLQWKRTIGILAIVFGAIRFFVCFIALQAVSALEGLASAIDENADLSDADLTRIVLYCQLAVLASMVILGIAVLIANKGTSNEMPRPKARKITKGILGLSIAFIVAEFIPSVIKPSSFSFDVSSIIFTVGYFAPLLIFCLLGLRSDPKNAKTVATPSSFSSPSTPILPTSPAAPTLPTSPYDAEIEALKKKIELYKLKQQLAQIEQEEQTELE